MPKKTNEEKLKELEETGTIVMKRENPDDFQVPEEMQGWLPVIYIGGPLDPRFNDKARFKDKTQARYNQLFTIQIPTTEDPLPIIQIKTYHAGTAKARKRFEDEAINVVRHQSGIVDMQIEAIHNTMKLKADEGSEFYQARLKRDFPVENELVMSLEAALMYRYSLALGSDFVEKFEDAPLNEDTGDTTSEEISDLVSEIESESTSEPEAEAPSSTVNSPESSEE
jgi:hypothetical protein